jgi:hypothetical protein
VAAAPKTPAPLEQRHPNVHLGLEHARGGVEQRRLDELEQTISARWWSCARRWECRAHFEQAHVEAAVGGCQAASEPASPPTMVISLMRQAPARAG